MTYGLGNYSKKIQEIKKRYFKGYSSFISDRLLNIQKDERDCRYLAAAYNSTNSNPHLTKSDRLHFAFECL
jgi:hypothetical protein